MLEADRRLDHAVLELERLLRVLDHVAHLQRARVHLRDLQLLPLQLPARAMHNKGFKAYEYAYSLHMLTRYALWIMEYLPVHYVSHEHVAATASGNQLSAIGGPTHV